MTSAPPILGLLGSLTDPTRVRLLRLVERQEVAVAELCEALQLPQSTVSRHLKVLSDDGWVGARREGTSNLYRLGGDEPSAKRLWSLIREQMAATDLARQDDQRLERVLATRQSRSQAFFASAAGQWDHLRDELFGTSFDLRALAGLFDERWTVGDLGCGTGGVAEAIAPFVAQVIAVDGSAAMLQAAKRRLKPLANVELRRGDFAALPIEDRALDAALAVLVLHHLSDPAQALGELARTLKPGGRALVVDMQPHDRVEYRAQMGHVWLGFRADELTRWAGEAGLVQARYIPLPPDPKAKGPPLFALCARRADARARASA